MSPKWWMRYGLQQIVTTGNLNLRYDSSNSGYLEILIRYGIRFCENDMNSALRIYDKYERYSYSEIKGTAPIAVSQ